MKGFKAEDLIEGSLRRYGKNLVIACSFGKDSIVVAHMAYKIWKDVKIMFNNTGVKFPETIKYKEKVTMDWKLNLIETKPIKPFWQCVKEYGIPKARGKGKHRVPKCCVYCKEKPASQWFKKNKTLAVVTGLMANESRQRGMLIKRYDNKIDSHDDVKFCGQRYFMRTDNIWKIHPLAHWSNEDIWRYIYNNKIPINPVYTKWGGIYKRSGCLPCTAYIEWEKKLSKTHNKLYLKLKELQDPLQERLI